MGILIRLPARKTAVAARWRRTTTQSPLQALGATFIGRFGSLDLGNRYARMESNGS